MTATPYAANLAAAAEQFRPPVDPDDIACVMRVALADVYGGDVNPDDRLHVLRLFPCPARYNTGRANGINWWMTQHVDVRLQAIADEARDWWNREHDVRDYDGRRPSEQMARQSRICAEDLARHLIRTAALEMAS